MPRAAALLVTVALTAPAPATAQATGLIRFGHYHTLDEIVNPDGRAISVDTPENHRWNVRPVDEDGMACWTARSAQG